MTDAALADPSATRALARLCSASPDVAVALTEPAVAGALGRIALASDFAIDTLVRQPALLLGLLADQGAAPVVPPKLHPDHRSEWPALLRRYRAAQSTQLIWRDVLGHDDVPVGSALLGAPDGQRIGRGGRLDHLDGDVGDLVRPDAGEAGLVEGWAHSGVRGHAHYPVAADAKRPAPGGRNQERFA